jgi:phosphate transport system substrate-binding protein
MTRGNIFLLVTVFFLLFIIAGDNLLSADLIRINGSGATLDMMRPMIAAYKNTNPAVSIEMEKPLGSSGAIKALIAGALDIAVSSKLLKPEEAAKGLQLKEFGKTPLAIITEKNVKKSDISSGELEDIFNGKTVNWANGEQIRLILRPMEDIDTSIIQSLTPGMNKAVYAAMNRPGMIVATTDPEAYALILKTQGAIGAASLTTLIVEKQPVNTLSLNKIKPAIQTLAEGKYPLAKNINFILMGKTTAAVIKFLDFIYSVEGRRIAATTGVIVTAK